MNKNTDYCKFVEDIKKEVQNIIKDWGAEAVFSASRQPGDRRLPDCKNTNR